MKIGILGAGVAGLAAAFDLTRHGHQVTIYEAGARPGGLASGFKDPSWDWELEKFYHHWFASDQDMLKLIAEMGQSDKVIFKRVITAVWYKERPYPFDSPLAFLTFPGFTLLDKVRFGLVGAYLRFTPFWRPLEQVTADNWMRRWFGDHIYDLTFQPLLEGKFGDEYYRQVNMAWMWARLHSRTARLGTFTGGFQAFIDTLTAQVQAQGAEVRLNCPVQAICPRPGGGLSFAADSRTDDYDAGLITVSPNLFSRLAQGLPESYLAGLQRLKSLGAVVMVMALKQKMTDWVYWLNLPKSDNFPFLAFVEHTNFIPSEHYGGDHLIYCGDYLPPEHPYFKMSQEELLRTFLPALKRFNPAFEAHWIRKTWLFRERYAQPVPPINHSHNIPDLRTPIPGLYFASMSQVYPWDRGTNYAVQIGRRAGQLIHQDFGSDHK